MTTLEAIQGILDREEYGSVITFVDGPHLGSKVVLTSDGNVAAGELPSDVSEHLTADSIVSRLLETVPVPRSGLAV